MKCWICGAPASTGEHKIKKSLLVALHGAGPYIDASALAHIKNGAASPLQGPGSKRVKYENSLCADCNSSRTQSYDRAFDKFFAFVIHNEDYVLKHRVIDFFDVYGESFPVDQLNLFKYFVKLLGCDLREHGYAVPGDLVSLLGQDIFQTGLKVSFAVNEDSLLLSTPSERSAGIGELNTTLRNLDAKDEPKYRWHTYFSFLHVYYWYCWEPDGPFGAPWIADSRYLYLGSYYPLSPEERMAFISSQAK